MANTEQSKKRARQSDARYDINKARRSRIRTFLRKVEEAISSGNAEAANAALLAAQPELDRGVSKGVLHKNTVSRKMSRLAARPLLAGFMALGLICLARRAENYRSDVNAEIGDLERAYRARTKF